MEIAELAFRGLLIYVGATFIVSILGSIVVVWMIKKMMK